MKKFDFHPIFCHVYAVVVAVVAFGVYLKTLAPTVSFFDSGELIAAAYTLGVAHPPGYPLYVLVGWLFAQLPLGSVAYRLNVMSACFAALAAITAYYMTYLLISARALGQIIDILSDMNETGLPRQGQMRRVRSCPGQPGPQ